VQAITIREEDFPLYRSRPDFIQRYIFPGGMLPTVSVMQQMAGQVGLSFETIERFGPSYAQTLRDWRAQFQTAWPKISALGFDERFRRMWDYYLTYCEVGFERGYTDVGIYRMTKPAD
jgi:cyclopropane-fatty-acyl-phospholipid synthase